MNKKEVASQIIDLENKCQQGEDFEENLAKMDEILASLSLEEFLELDEYIAEELEKL